MDAASPAYLEATGQVAPVRRPTPGAAFELARQWLRDGRKLDMAALAAELGVSRGTIYRWTGDRDRLLADVISSDLNDAVAYVYSHAPGRGAERIHHTVDAVLDLIADQFALRAFLRNEGEAGLQLVTAPRGAVRTRLLEQITELMQAEIDAGHYRAPAPAGLLADGILSLGERFLHNGGDPTLNPDRETAKTVVRLLLREAPEPRPERRRSTHR